MRDALGWTTTESLIAVGLFMVAVLAVVIISTRLAKADPRGLAIFAVGLVAAVVLYPIAPLPLAVTAFLLVRRWRRRRRIAAGLAVDPRTARRWAKAAPEGPAPAPRVADPEFAAVAARCQGNVWPEAMVGAGLARRVVDDYSDTGLMAAVGAVLRHLPSTVATVHGDSYHVPQVVTCASSPVGAVIKVRPLPGQGPADFATAMRADRIAAHLRVPVEVQPGSLDGLVTILARWRDPMRDLVPLDAAPAWSGDWGALPLGTDEQGQTVTMPLANVSGTVVGGLPGGGKSASIATALAPLLADDRVQFCVFDGKGGSDWAWMEPRAALFNNDDEDLEQVAGQLESLVAVMRWRLQNMRRLRGGSSIWNTGGPTPDLPLMCVLVDECQTYLDKGNIPRGDKEKSAARDRIEAALATLVRKGRSVGVWVVLTTQKPTSDSLPTTIGANAATAIALRVKTAAAEVAIFGEGVEEGEASARDLPAVPGYAVMGTEDGHRVRFRFGYLPEDRLESLAQDSAGLARPDQLAPPAEPADQEPAEEPATAGHPDEGH